jgi:hypothetical protein
LKFYVVRKEKQCNIYWNINTDEELRISGFNVLYNLGPWILIINRKLTNICPTLEGIKSSSISCIINLNLTNVENRNNQEVIFVDLIERIILFAFSDQDTLAAELFNVKLIFRGNNGRSYWNLLPIWSWDIRNASTKSFSFHCV